MLQNFPFDDVSELLKQFIFFFHITHKMNLKKKNNNKQMQNKQTKKNQKNKQTKLIIVNIKVYNHKQ